MRNGFAKFQTGWVVSEEELKGYVDSKIHPGYGFSDTAVKNGQIIIKIGLGNLVFPGNIKAGKDITEEQNAFQEIKGKVTMFHNNYASERVLWSDVVKMYEEAGTIPDSVEAEKMGIKFYPFPLPYFSQAGGKAFAKALMDGDGPGNGGGSPSASMKFYFSKEAISPEQIKQIRQYLAEGSGAFVMTPFYGMNPYPGR